MVRILFLILLFVGAPASSAWSQTSQDPMVEGILAFREGRYQEAAKAFEKAVAADDNNAQAHFLLARVYFETELKDDKRAGRELDRALEIDPENVVYLTARMQQLSVDSKSFLRDKIRESRRRELARTILKLDSTNAFAHAELGDAYIRDFWRYRNALMYPTVQFNEYEYRSRQSVDPMATALRDQIEDLGSFDPDNQEPVLPDASEALSTALPSMNPQSIFLADEFDIETLEAQGIPVVDFSRRAQRAYDRAIFHLYKALDADPRNRIVYDRLMEVYALKGEWSDALEMLQQMYVYFPEDPELWTYLGLAHHRFGNLDAAAKAFESSFEGMDQGMLAAFTDIEFLMPDEEKKRYREDPSGYAARYWTSKDPRYLTPYNERKLEHYSRLTYADLLYGSSELGLHGWETERGAILVRYGTPKGDVVVIPKSTSGVNRGTPVQTGTQSTDPTQAGTRLALQVAQRGTDFALDEEANTFNIWDYGDFKFVFEDPFRNGEYRMYSPSAADLSQGAVPWVNDYTIKAAETIRETPDRYEYEAPGRQIELPFLVSAFKGSTGRTDLFVNYGIPILEFGDQGDMIDITANAGTFVVSENRDILAERRRTIYGLRTDQIVEFEEANLWIDSEEVSVPAGQVDVSVEFETTSGGTVAVQRRSVSVPDFDTSELILSDILLAYRVEETDDGRPLAGSDVVRNGLSITPAPWSVFSLSNPIYVYFEVYNLDVSGDGRADYEVEAALQPKEQGNRVGRFVRGIFGGGDKGVSVSVPVSVASTSDGQYLIIDAEAQPEGLYTLFLKVTDRKSGREVTRQRDLFLESSAAAQ
ncbi:MAG: tetratricopeptide repeat protein [Rhodothermales bacterium]|nr:tetratricopeptide repeat protein [Rhodothermales bacterium]